MILYVIFVWYVRRIWCRHGTHNIKCVVLLLFYIYIWMSLIWFRILVSEKSFNHHHPWNGKCQPLSTNTSTSFYIWGMLCFNSILVFRWGGGAHWSGVWPAQGLFATNRPNHQPQQPTVIVAIVNDDDQKKKKKKQRLLIVYPVFSLLQTTALISKLCIWPPYRKDAALRLTQQQQQQQRRQQQQQQQHLDDGDNVQ